MKRTKQEAKLRGEADCSKIRFKKGDKKRHTNKT